MQSWRDSIFFLGLQLTGRIQTEWKSVFSRMAAKTEPRATLSTLTVSLSLIYSTSQFFFDSDTWRGDWTANITAKKSNISQPRPLSFRGARYQCFIMHFSSVLFRFTPLESPSIPACPALGRDRGRQTGMQGMVEIESISSLLRARSKPCPFKRGLHFPNRRRITAPPAYLEAHQP